MKERIDYLAKRINLSGQDILTYDEISAWPAEEVKTLENQGYITQIEDADGIVCDQCDERCYKTVETRKDLRSGNMIGTFFCEDEDNGGPVSVDLIRLQQWKINTEQFTSVLLPVAEETNGEPSVNGRKTKFEKTAAIAKYLEAKPTATSKEIQKATGIDDSDVRRLWVPIKKAIKEGKSGVPTGYKNNGDVDGIDIAASCKYLP